VTIAGLTVRNGRANLQGGGVNNRAGATLVLSNTAVSGNVAAVMGGLFGGGIYSEGGLTLLNSTVTSNTNGPANAVGGGITFVGLNQTLVLSNTTISANSTADLGGGLYAGAAIVTITHSTLDNNQALYGGGLYAYDSQVALVNSTLSGNSSRHSGGGLFNHTGSTGLFNVTITNNTADSDANGAGGGGGFALSGGLISGRSSLIAGNYQLDPFGGGGVIQVDDDCLGAFTSLDVNLLVAPANGGCAVTAARLSTFPALGPLADNGGPTRTHALLAGSAGLDAGQATGCLGWDGQLLARDQRGTPRPLFGGSALACDLGAFEYVGPVFMPFLQR
jgi:hypothetical protein